MRYFLHIAQHIVHITRSFEDTFARTTFVLRREMFGSHLVVDSNCKIKNDDPIIGFAV